MGPHITPGKANGCSKLQKIMLKSFFFYFCLIVFIYKNCLIVFISQKKPQLKIELEDIRLERSSIIIFFIFGTTFEDSPGKS